MEREPDRDPVISVPRPEFEDLLHAAAARGARQALAELGLENGHASRDIRELRDLLAAWRAVKSTALHTVVRILTTILLAALLALAGIKLKLLG